jgi:hypothetical protein
MKQLLWIVLITVGLFSCTRQTTVVNRSTTVVKKDNGKHKGWYKNPNNPHHPSHNRGSTVVVVNQNNGNGSNAGGGNGNGNGNEKNKGKGKGKKK